MSKLNKMFVVSLIFMIWHVNDHLGHSIGCDLDEFSPSLINNILQREGMKCKANLKSKPPKWTPYGCCSVLDFYIRKETNQTCTLCSHFRSIYENYCFPDTNYCN